MSILLEVNQTHFDVFNREEIERRLAARNIGSLTGGLSLFKKLQRFSDGSTPDPEFYPELATCNLEEDLWVELGLTIEKCHPDASLDTSALLIDRILAEDDYEKSPFDTYHQNRLWDESRKQPATQILELSAKFPDNLDDGNPSRPYLLNVLVLVPNYMVEGRFIPSESCAWGGGTGGYSDKERVEFYAPLGLETRFIEPAFSVPADKICLHKGEIWGVRGSSLVKLIEGESERGSDEVVLELKGKNKFYDLCSDGEFIWAASGGGLLKIQEGEILKTFDKKGGLLRKKADAVASGAAGIAVGTTAGFQLIQNDEIVETVTKGLGSKDVQKIQVDSQGRFWFFDIRGPTLRKADGSLKRFARKEFVALGQTKRRQVVEFLSLPDNHYNPRLPSLGEVNDAITIEGKTWIIMKRGSNDREDVLLIRIAENEEAVAFPIKDCSKSSSMFTHNGVLYANNQPFHLDSLEDALTQPAASAGMYSVPIVDSFQSTAKKVNGEKIMDSGVDSKAFLFTGTLESMSRKKAQEKVRTGGGKTPSSVTKNLDFLVIGDKDFIKYEGGWRSSKLKKAEQYINDGLALRIINESEFIKMLENA